MLSLLLIQGRSSGQEHERPDLTVEIDQLRSDSGQVMVELKNAKEERAAGQVAPISDASSKVSFDGLEKGSYAVRFFHDENRNGEMDRKGLLPDEGYGYSNNARGTMGPPDFSKQLFRLRKDTTIRIHAIYRGG